MSAVVAALFETHARAEQVRTALVSDGFPTDRVQLTSPREPGQAALSPRGGKLDQLQDYFAQLFPEEDERSDVLALAEGVRQGHAALVVHPRGDIEVERALGILSSASPLEIREHDLENQTMEQAASPDQEMVLHGVLPEVVVDKVLPKEPRGKS